MVQKKVGGAGQDGGECVCVGGGSGVACPQQRFSLLRKFSRTQCDSVCVCISC